VTGISPFDSGGTVHIISQTQMNSAGEVGAGESRYPAPKEQPPRKLSGKRTAGGWISGKQAGTDNPASPKGASGRRFPAAKSLRFRDRVGRCKRSNPPG